MKIPIFLFLIFLFLFASTVFSADQMFDFSITCDLDQTFCDKVGSAFNSVGQIISDDLILTERIDVVVLFEPLEDKVLALTGLNQPILPSEDGRERAFPSALVKQKADGPDLGDKPDIEMDVTSINIEKFWFPGDPDIKEDQVDFRILALHEMVHGLGITTAWELQFTDEDEFLTPRLRATDNEDGSLTFESFDESIFDSFIVNNSEQKRITEITQLLNDIAVPGTRYDNLNDLFDKIIEGQSNSGNGEIFTNLMLEWTTTEDLLGFFVPETEDFIALETSQFFFESGTTLSHVSTPRFEDSDDFLMVMELPEGITLEQKVLDTGNHPGGGIGPQLLLILEKIGYAISDNLKPSGSQVKSKATTFSTNFTSPLRFMNGKKIVDKQLKKPISNSTVI